MPPTTSRDFQKVAGQRLTTAETLLREKLTSGRPIFRRLHRRVLAQGVNLAPDSRSRQAG